MEEIASNKPTLAATDLLSCPLNILVIDFDILIIMIVGFSLNLLLSNVAQV